MALNHDLITGILTKERIRIVNHLREHGPVDSLQELAEALGRDRSAVSRDLVALENSLVEVKKIGRQKTIRATNRPILIY